MLVRVILLASLCRLHAQVPTGTSWAGCTATQCTSPDGEGGNDCLAGNFIEPCTCSQGLFARLTGPSLVYEDPGNRYYEYACCPSDSPDTVGETCGDFQPPPTGCTTTTCTSAGDTHHGTNSRDCWAGSGAEPCTCSVGEARLFSPQPEGDHDLFYFYACCPSDSPDNDGEECGDYRNGGAAVGISLAVLAGLLALAFCYHKKTGKLEYHVNKCCCCTLHRGMQCWFAIITVVSVRQLLLLFMMKAQDEIHDDHRGPLVVAIIADFVRMIVCIVQLWAICTFNARWLAIMWKLFVIGIIGDFAFGATSILNPFRNAKLGVHVVSLVLTALLELWMLAGSKRLAEKIAAGEITKQNAAGGNCCGEQPVPPPAALEMASVAVTNAPKPEAAA